MKNILHLIIVAAALAMAGCASPADNNDNGVTDQVQPSGQMDSPPPIGGGGTATPSTGTP